MIKTFCCKETEKVFHRLFTKKFAKTIYKPALRKLLIIDAATEIDELKVPPGNRLEKLKGNRKEQYSIRINNQWRICFTWKNGDAYDLEITDYH